MFLQEMFLLEQVTAQYTGSDRRQVSRFPIERDVRFRVLNKKYQNETGTGRTVNISSRGLLLESDVMLVPGRKIEVSVSWPVQLDQRCALRLVAIGKVVRCNQNSVAIAIQQYEFRTQALPRTA